jgi:GLPGLI family protein
MSCLYVTLAHAQVKFITSGKIEFERRTNQHALIDDDSYMKDLLKRNMPQFVTSYFTLSFRDNYTLYAGHQTDGGPTSLTPFFMVQNTVRTNLDSGTSLTQKELFTEAYLIADSVRKIEWKITRELREIAGFSCRKAVGKIFDSIVVIAFYADEILPRGGPESFCGLPGIILGVAIPRLHTTWYATKLQLSEVKPADVAPPTKGKKYTGPAFRADAKDIFKSWGKSNSQMEWQMLL